MTDSRRLSCPGRRNASNGFEENGRGAGEARSGQRRALGTGAALSFVTMLSACNAALGIGEAELICLDEGRCEQDAGVFPARAQPAGDGGPSPVASPSVSGRDAGTPDGSPGPVAIPEGPEMLGVSEPGLPLDEASSGSSSNDADPGRDDDDETAAGGDTAAERDDGDDGDGIADPDDNPGGQGSSTDSEGSSAPGAGDGVDDAPLPPAPDADPCEPDRGQCDRVCDAGQSRCRGARLERCNSTRTAFEPIDECSSPQACNEAAGACNICTPGSQRCRDTRSIVACDASGQSEVLVACGLLEACVSGQCVTLGLPL